MKCRYKNCVYYSQQRKSGCSEMPTSKYCNIQKRNKKVNKIEVGMTLDDMDTLDIAGIDFPINKDKEK